MNPVNHEHGCDFCIAKCLKENEIPSCFFKKASADLTGHSDWSFVGFANKVLREGVKPWSTEE